MKRITIGNKEYTFEFSIEASLYDECTTDIMDTFVKGGMTQSAAENNDLEGVLDNFLETIALLPQKTLSIFYAGLLEHHGPEGDNSVKSKQDAKRILKTYLEESNKSFRDVFGEMMELMVNDNFFEKIGLNQIADELTKETNKKTKTSNKAGKDTSEE